MVKKATRRKWRLTVQGRMFLLVIGIVLTAAYLLNHSLLFLLAALFVGTFAYDGLLLKVAFPKFELGWDVPEQVFAGKRSHLPVQITNKNRIFPLRQFQVQLRGRGIATQHLVADEIKPDTTATLEAVLTPSARGRWILHDASVICSYPFGFWECRQDFPVDLHLLVFPALLQQAPENLLGFQKRRGIIPKNAQDFQYLANYQSGDDVRLIHWRKSTLLENPVIRKDLTSLKASKPKMLIPDPSPSFELGVSALATLTVTASNWNTWYVWTPKGPKPLPSQHAMLMTLATLQPLNQDEIAKAEAGSQMEAIRISEIAAATPWPSDQPAKVS